MRYALHLTDNFTLLETIADNVFNIGHKNNFLVVYENGKIHTILKSPKKVTFT